MAKGNPETSAKYGSTVRIPHEIYDRASSAAKECGVSVGSFFADAVEDVLKGYEAKAPILPRCIAKAEAHSADPVVKAAKPHQLKAGKRKVSAKQPVRNIIA